MLGSSKLVAFAPVTDIDRARAFYVGLLGLTLVEDTPFALVCSANGVTVRITPVGELAPQPFTILGWAVGDIAETSSALRDAGVEVMRVDGLEHDELGVWTAPGGDRIAWFHDPDGNVLSISQHITTPD